MTTGETEPDIERLFQDLDRNGDGTIARSEVREAFKRLRLPYSKDAVEEFYSLADVDCDGKVTLKEFAEFIVKRRVFLAGVFDRLDRNNDGRICVDDLRVAAHQMGFALSKSDLRSLISHLDANNSGDVDFNEFCGLLLLVGDLRVSELFEHWIRHSAIDTGEYDPPPEKEEGTPTWVLLLSGGFAGAVSRTLTAPMDRMKTLLQAQGTQTLDKARHVQFTGIRQGLLAVYQEGGLRAFWRGNGANVVKIAPETACKFWAYETLKLLLTKDPDNPTMVERFAAGALAGATAQAAIYPLEITKTRIALSATGEYKGIADCLFKIVRHEGVFSMYRGMGASLAGIVPYSGVDLTIYSLLKEQYALRFPDEDPGVMELLACGAIATTCGQLVAYPLQLIRTRLQAQGMYGRPVVYSGAIDCFRQTVQADGIKGLYRGILINFSKSLPAISCSYAVYETTKRWLSSSVV